ncbi:hypothetical protein KAR10_10225, partial [bacterium]|nr:hypothetical protein [bacterium]
YNHEITLKPQKDGVHIRVLGKDPMIYLPAQHLEYDGEYQVSVKMDSKVTTYSQLFYLDNERQSFSQEHSRIKPVVVGTNYLNFDLPADSFYYPKRFDPSMRPGNFVIKAIMLRRLAGKPNCAGTPGAGRKAGMHPVIVSEKADLVLPAWDFMAKGNTNSRCRAIPGGMLVHAGQNDPFFTLPPLPGMAAASRPVLVLELDVPEGSVCQIFYKQSQTAVYTEKLSKQKPVHPGFNRLRFELDPEILQYPLRIDPGTQKGNYLIRSARMEGIITGTDSLVGPAEKHAGGFPNDTVHMIYPSALVKRIMPKELSATIKVMQQTVIQAEPGELLLIAQGNDPGVYLPPVGEATAAGYYKVIINLLSPGATSAQLFYLDNNHQAYNEENSMFKKLQPGENQLEYVLGAEILKNPLRFDFACDPGTYKLASLEIHRITVLDHKK